MEDKIEMIGQQDGTTIAEMKRISKDQKKIGEDRRTWLLTAEGLEGEEEEEEENEEKEHFTYLGVKVWNEELQKGKQEQNTPCNATWWSPQDNWRDQDPASWSHPW